MTDIETSGDSLQVALFELITGDARITDLANDLFDHVPRDPWGEKGAYLSFGAADSVEDDAECITGLVTTQQIDVWSKGVGRRQCQRLVDLVRKRLHRASLDLPDAAVVEVRVTQTRVLPDPRNLITHGVVQVSLTIEEAA